MRLSRSFAGLRLQVHSWCGAGLNDQPGPVLGPQPPSFFAQPGPSLGLSWFRQILLSEEKNRKKIIYTLIRLSSMRALQNWSQIVKIFSRSYLTRRWPITGTRPITSTGLPSTNQLLTGTSVPIHAATVQLEAFRGFLRVENECRTVWAGI